jgi:hypothetical protein
VERETARHDSHNLILCLEHVEGLTRQEAVDEVTARSQAAIDRFIRLAEGVPEVCDSLGLGEADVLRTDHAVHGMQNWIRGNYDWASQSSRYAGTAQHTTPYLADLLQSDLGTC